MTVEVEAGGEVATPSVRMVEMKPAAIEGGVQRLSCWVRRRPVAFAVEMSGVDAASAMAETRRQ